MSPLLPRMSTLERTVLVAPVEGGEAMLVKSAVADFRPDYLLIVFPQGVSEDVIKGISEDVKVFALPIKPTMGINGVPISSSLIDAVVAIRRAIMASRESFFLKGFTLKVNIALFDNAPNWLNIVLYSTAPIIKALVYEGIGLGVIKYYTLNETRDVVEPSCIPILDLGGEAYTVLKLMTKVKSAVSADVINAMYNETGNKVSKRYILKLLDRLIEAGLVERIGSGNKFLYRLTPLGDMLVG